MVQNLRGVPGALVAMGLLMFAAPAARADYVSISVAKAGVGIGELGAGNSLPGITLGGYAGVEAGGRFTETRTESYLGLNLTGITVTCGIGEGKCGFMFDIMWSTLNPFLTSGTELSVFGTTTGPIQVTAYSFAAGSVGGPVPVTGGTISGKFVQSYENPVWIDKIRMTLNVGFDDPGTVTFPGSFDGQITAPITTVPEPIPVWFSPVVLAATVVLSTRRKRSGV
jgi:hypothetical protein